MYEFSTLGWLKHVIFHPGEGFEDLRWKKQGSIKLTIFIVFMLFVAMMADYRLMGFQFNMNYTKVFNVVPIIVRSVVYYLTWCIGNWSICTLFDGEGTFKKICVNTAYALVPFIVCDLISTFMSNFLIQDESIWMTAIYYLGIGWSFILLVQGMKAVHQYSMKKTLVSMFFTIVAMLLILFLIVLLLSLFQQVYVFVYSIVMEIQYRIRG